MERGRGKHCQQFANAFLIAAILDYCTSVPFVQAGVRWPATISSIITAVVLATCDNGYNESQQGAPTVTCSAGGSIAGSGIWSNQSGNCSGKLLFHLYFQIRNTNSSIDSNSQIY